MTLEFTREVIILNGLPVLGTITVEIEFERDEHDGLFFLYPTCIGFEPETPIPGLLWPTVDAPCTAWLAQNKDRVERKTLERP